MDALALSACSRISYVRPGGDAGTKSALAASSLKRCSRGAENACKERIRCKKDNQILSRRTLRAHDRSAVGLKLRYRFSRKQLGVAEFIAVTELVLLLCVPFMIRTPRSRGALFTLLSSASYVAKSQSCF